MSDKKPTFQLVAPPAKDGGFWPEVGVAWEKTDANGETYFSISIPLLGNTLILRKRKEWDADKPSAKTSRKPKKVTEDEIPF